MRRYLARSSTVGVRDEMRAQPQTADARVAAYYRLLDRLASDGLDASRANIDDAYRVQPVVVIGGYVSVNRDP